VGVASPVVMSSVTFTNALSKAASKAGLFASVIVMPVKDVWACTTTAFEKSKFCTKTLFCGRKVKPRGRFFPVKKLLSKPNVVSLVSRVN